MTRLDYECAVIFSEEDVKHDFIGCVATVIEDCDEAIVLVRASNYIGIKQIAEIICSHERGNGPEWKISVNQEEAGQLGISEIPAELFSIAMLLKNRIGSTINFNMAFEIAKLITENFSVSQK